MIGGLLAGITDPKVMAEVEERCRIIAKLAKQMGVTENEARDVLWNFEAVTSSDGHTLH